MKFDRFFPVLPFQPAVHLVHMNRVLYNF